MRDEYVNIFRHFPFVFLSPEFNCDIKVFGFLQRVRTEMMGFFLYDLF